MSDIVVILIAFLAGIFSNILTNISIKILSNIQKDKKYEIKVGDTTLSYDTHNVEEIINYILKNSASTSNKIFTIIGGVNGVGKSSLSGVLLNENIDLGIIIDPDKLTVEQNGDRIKGGKEAIKIINSCIEKGINFTQETTLSGMRTLKTIQLAKEHGYIIRLYYVGINSSDESIKRIHARVEKGGHDIPTDDVKRRYNKRFEDLEKVLPYCNEAFFYDNEKGFKMKAEYRNGSLNITDSTEPIPEWIKKFRDYLTK